MNPQTGSKAARLARAVLGLIIKTGSMRSSFKSTLTPLSPLYSISCLDCFNRTLVYPAECSSKNAILILLLSCLNSFVQDKLQICLLFPLASISVCFEGSTVVFFLFPLKIF